MISILKKNLLQFQTSLILLILICGVKYLIIPEYSDFEIFSYAFMFGVILYLIYYVLKTLINITSLTVNIVLSIIFSFLIQEIIMLLLVRKNLLSSIFNDSNNIPLFLIYHIITISVTTFTYLKNRLNEIKT